MPSSSAYSNCRIDWRPSPGLRIALLILALLAVVSLWLSALPTALAGAGSLAVLDYTLRLLRQEAAREAFRLNWNSSEKTAELNFERHSQSLQAVRVVQRGPLATLQACDERGRRQRYVWWPDTLPADARRQLRLATVAARPARR